MTSFVLYASVAIGILFLILSIVLHVCSCKAYREHTTTLQKALMALTDLRFILALFTIYYFQATKTKYSLEDKDDQLINMYIETIIVTLNSVFSTLLWFVMFLVSYGWHIHRNIFTRQELRKLVGIFILLYIIVCFDQILDLVFKVSIYNVK
jgi:hypothetical protein